MVVNQPIKTCLQCGKQFRHYTTVYCSRRCASEVNAKARVEKQKEFKARLVSAEEELQLLRSIIRERIKRVHLNTPCEFCAKGVLLCLLDGGNCYVKGADKS